jgi:hypothetical protein
LSDAHLGPQLCEASGLACEGYQMTIRNNIIPGSTTRRICDLPGPGGLPLIGNALQARGESLHQTLEHWSREYGTSFRFRIAWQE